MVTFKRENRRVVSAAVVTGLFMTLAACALVLTAPAQAQQQPAKKAPAASAKKTTSSAWVKLCEEEKGEKKRTICLTHHERFHPTTGQPLISAAIRKFSGQGQESLMIMVPLGRMLKPGMFLRVDKEKPHSLGSRSPSSIVVGPTSTPCGTKIVRAYWIVDPGCHEVTGAGGA